MKTVTWKYKLFMLGLFSLSYLVFYIYPNFHPSFHPFYLPLLEIDYAVPFLPWTFIVYLSDYLLIATVIAMISEKARFKSFSRACFFTLIMCGTFFLFFPTRYPRPEYPAVENAIVAFFMGLVGNYDTPNNCFPSMHVAITGSAAWCLRHRGPKIFIPYSLWAIAIFATTMTTKQHYFVDILGGVAVTATVALIEWAFFQKDFLNVSQVARRFPLSRSALND